MLVNNINFARTAPLKFGEGYEEGYKEPKIEMPNLYSEPLKEQDLFLLGKKMLSSYRFVALLRAKQKEQDGNHTEARKLRENAEDCHTMGIFGSAPDMISKAIKKEVEADYRKKDNNPVLEMPVLDSDPLEQQPSLGTDILKAYRYVTLLNAQQREREEKSEEAQILKENAFKCHDMEKNFAGSSISSAIRVSKHMCAETSKKITNDETLKRSKWELPSRGRWGF